MGARGTFAVAVMVTAATSAPARAGEHARARLVYDAPEACPDEPALRQEVLARLGYDPFDDSAKRLVTATIQRSEGTFVARVSLREAGGTVRTREPLYSAGTRCDEIASAVVLAVSIAIDPLSLTRPTPSEAAPPPSRRAPAPDRESVVPPPPPASPATERTPIVAWLGAGALTSLGLLPSPSFGIEASGLLERGALGLRLGARYELPASTDGPVGGSVQASVALGSVGLCYHRGPFLGCGVGAAGALFGESRGISHPSTAETFYGSVGGHVGALVPFTRSFAGRVALEGGVPLLPTSLHVAGREAWRTPAVYGSLSIGIMAKVF